MLLTAQTQQLLGTSRSVVKREEKKKRSEETAEKFLLVWRKKRELLRWRVNGEGLGEEEVAEGSSRKKPLINQTAFKTETVIQAQHTHAHTHI